MTVVDSCIGSSDSYPGGLDDDGRVDRGWTCVVNTCTPDRVDRTVSVMVYSFLVNPQYPRVMTMTVTNLVRVTGPRIPGWLGGSGGDGKGRGFVRRTSEFLVGWIRIIVTTVIYHGTPSSCSYQPDGGGVDPGFL